ncbi:MAG TPA: DUF480 domain-containing protein [Acidimicrobiales bacterium]|nr:DUF480 domain-containing protein [Acidimicrobiales bacterium]
MDDLALTPVSARVLGALVEKQLTTPQQYPLTMNALQAACNQTSSRNPVVTYEEQLLDTTVASLKSRGLLRFVHPSHGRSATRYRQVLEEVLDLDVQELALVAVLLLRGPQTVGELRSRTERMAEFKDLREVEDRLEALASRPDPLAARLPREPGRKEERWVQLLAADTGAVDTSPPRGEGRPSEAGPSLAMQVVALQAEVAALRRDLDELIERLGS